LPLVGGIKKAEWLSGNECEPGAEWRHMGRAVGGQDGVHPSGRETVGFLRPIGLIGGTRPTADNIEAVIPRRKGSNLASDHDRKKYKWRHLVENFFCHIKEFRRIATRYEKKDTCFAAMIHLVGAVLWTR
jgi:hypothetical protein